MDNALQLYAEAMCALALYEYWLYQPRIIVSNATTSLEVTNE